MRIILISILGFLVINVFGDNIDYLSISSGCFDFIKHEYRAAEIRIEYKPSYNLQTIRPLFGVSLTHRGSVYCYSGLSLDLFFNRHCFFSPSFAAGVYYAGNGKNLGFPIEFRSGIEFGWRFNNNYRLSSHVCHISNASLASKNPGEESLVLSLSIPIKVRSKKCR